MVLPAHNRLIVSGVFGNASAPAEIWSIRLTTPPDVFADQAARQAAATALKTSWATLMAPNMPSWVVATRFRLSQHVEGGDTSLDAGGAYNQADDTTVVPGSGPSGTVYPLATALCISLDTTRDGPTGKGRFFLPMPALTLSGDFRISEQAAGDFATAVQNWLNEVRAIPGVSDLVVASSKGYLSQVTAVKVGRVPDTMRSRRGDQLEGYVSRPIPF